MKLKTLVLLFITSILLYSCSSNKEPVTKVVTPKDAHRFEMVASCNPGTNQYAVYVTGYDFGPAVDKLVLHCDHFVIPEDVYFADFEITVRAKAKNFLGSFIQNFSYGNLIPYEAYTSDNQGNRITTASEYITCNLIVDPEEMWCNPFLKEAVYKHNKDSYAVRIKNKKLQIKIKECAGMVNPLVAQFHFDHYCYSNMIMQYASWEPSNTDTSLPLLIWLHTVSDGGSDPNLPLLNCKVTSLITPEFQKYFNNGLCVLVPQAPGVWLETKTTDFTGNRVWAPVDKDGVIRTLKKPFSFFNQQAPKNSAGVEENSEEAFASVSYYTDLLKNTIEQYLITHPYIDRKRIYIMGASAGGYMVMNMCIQYPEYFAAAVPICENYKDTKIADWQLDYLRTLPLWFVHARNDASVNYNKYDKATYNRLLKTGAQNCHYTLYDAVKNVENIRTGYDFDADDKDEIEEVVEKKEKYPLYEYTDHSVWVNVFNGTCYDGDLYLFDWLSQQHKR